MQLGTRNKVLWAQTSAQMCFQITLVLIKKVLLTGAISFFQLTYSSLKFHKYCIVLWSTVSLDTILAFEYQAWRPGWWGKGFLSPSHHSKVLCSGQGQCHRKQLAVSGRRELLALLGMTIYFPSGNQKATSLKGKERLSGKTAASLHCCLEMLIKLACTFQEWESQGARSVSSFL